MVFNIFVVQAKASDGSTEYNVLPYSCRILKIKKTSFR